MSELKAIQPDWKIHIANALRKGKDATNDWGRLPQDWPVVGGMGTGDLLFGESPEVMDDWAHGFPPYTGSGQTTRLDDRLLDVAGVPVPYAAAGLAGKAGTKALARKLRGEKGPNIVDMSRRDAMKKIAAGTGAVGVAATGAMGTHAMLKALRDTAPVVAKDVGARAAAGTAAKLATRTIPYHLAPIYEMLRMSPELLSHFKSKGRGAFTEEMAEGYTDTDIAKMLDEIDTEDSLTAGWGDPVTPEFAHKSMKELSTTTDKVLNDEEMYSDFLSNLFADAESWELPIRDAIDGVINNGVSEQSKKILLRLRESPNLDSTFNKARADMWLSDQEAPAMFSKDGLDNELRLDTGAEGFSNYTDLIDDMLGKERAAKRIKKLNEDAAPMK